MTVIRNGVNKIIYINVLYYIKSKFNPLLTRIWDKMIDTFLTKKKFKVFFQKNVAAL